MSWRGSCGWSFCLSFWRKPWSRASWRVTRWREMDLGLPLREISWMRWLKKLLAPRWVEMISSWPPQVMPGREME